MSGREHIIARITDRLGDHLPLEREAWQKAAGGWQLKKIAAEPELLRCLAPREAPR